MRTHFPWKELGYATGFIFLLLAFCVGAYFGTVTRANAIEYKTISEVRYYEYLVDVPGSEPEKRIGSRTLVHTVPVDLDDVVASYPLMDIVGPNLVHAFFAPIHNIDRQVRIEFWKDQHLKRMPDLTEW